MYCPQCGLQLATEIRFCSRCGLPLSAVADIVARGGWSQPPAHAPGAKERQEHNRGVRLGVKLMFLAIVLLPICFGASFVVDGPAPLLIPVTVLLIGFLWLIYSKVFGEDPVLGHPQNLGYPDGRGHYPASLSANGYAVDRVNAPRPNTAEIVEPPNVTDHTTKLFD